MQHHLSVRLKSERTLKKLMHYLHFYFHIFVNVMLQFSSVLHKNALS